MSKVKILALLLTFAVAFTVVSSAVFANDVPLSMRLTGHQTIDHRAFFVGPVMRSYDDSRSWDTRSIDFADFINESANTIRSVTGEVFWDYGNGFVTLNTPNAQGATGFLGRRNRVRLNDVVIETRNEFSTYLIISLDGRPIAESEKILIQSGQNDKLYGYRESYELDAHGNRTGRRVIDSIGNVPFNVQRTQAVVQLNSFPNVGSVVVLDVNGYPREYWDMWTTDARGRTTILLPEDSMYTVITRGAFADSIEVTERAAHTVVTGYDYIWWEAEEYTTISGLWWHNHFRPEQFPETRYRLSGGDWLTNDWRGPLGDGAEMGWTNAHTIDPPTVTYDIEVLKEAGYDLFVRKFWLHGWFRWRFGDDEWSYVNDTIMLIDDTALMPFTGANWVHIGNVDLAPGTHTLTVEQIPRGHGQERGVALAHDAFVLSSIPFAPQGLNRPGGASGNAMPGWWAFEPGNPRFGPDNVMDMRWLNEEYAGMNGPIRQEGESFYLGCGTPVRFWGVNVGSNIANASYSSMDYFARLLAAYGVNLVRMHYMPWDVHYDLSEHGMRQIQRFVYALRNNGIYTKLSHYFVLWNRLQYSRRFAHNGRFHPETGEMEGFLPHTQEGFGFLLWNEYHQDVYFEVLAELLTTVNPYTGIPLINDPAVAFIEANNEDSFFFYTFATWRMGQADVTRFGIMFGEWLVEKYGSLGAVLEHWGPMPATLNIPDNHETLYFRFMGWGQQWLWTHFEQARARDMYEFLLVTQRSFYQRFEDHMRYLGFEGVTMASNWMAAGPDRHDAGERWTYLPTGLTSRNSYASNSTHFTERPWQVEAGDLFIDSPVTLNPRGMPVQKVITQGQGNAITEMAWINPSNFKVDEPFMQAVYGGLQGINLMTMFTNNHFDWQPLYAKWGQGTPSRMGQWPGFALAYRRFDIQTGQPVAIENIPFETLISRPASGQFRTWNRGMIDDYRAHQH